MSNERNRQSWNALSKFYQRTHRISLDDVHYGPYSPGEKDLQIIGEVKDLDVLELGCGGGQISVVLAKWGARSVTGMDISDEQLSYAQKLALEHGVKVRFLQGNVEDLSALDDDSFDLVVSSHALNYVEHLFQVFAESARVLRPGGRCVFCLGHPVYYVLGDALEVQDLSLIEDYFSDERHTWDWLDDERTPIATFEQTYWRLDQIINGLIAAGFSITRVEEPKGYTLAQIEEQGLDPLPFIDDDFDTDEARRFIETCSKIPFSLIVAANLKMK